jgi:serine/threonine-protein kinase
MHDAMIGRTVLGRYRVVRALAKGGMGVVYLARGEGASGFTKPVVVKRMASDLMVDQSMARMFVREARLMSRLRHPCLVGVADFGEERGDYLMIIEYVHGYHLGQWHRFHKRAYGPFPLDLIIHIVIKVLDALHYAHNLKGDDGELLHIVHRDVSPANILLDVEGLVKLADFGVARSTDQTEQTEQSTIKGKMPYLAPELFRLEDPSPSSDAYACAVVLHEVLVGQNEFRAKDVATTVSRVLEHTPTPVTRIRPDAPKRLEAILEKALAKTPTERFADAAELAAALREVRPGTEEEMHARLVEIVQRDFNDQRFSELIGFPSLAEREEAWKNPPISSEPPAAHVSSSPPTMPNRGETVDVDMGMSRRSPWPWIALAVLGASAIAAVAVVVVTSSSGTEASGAGQTFVVVQSGGSEGDGGTASPETATPAGDASDDAGDDQPDVGSGGDEGPAMRRRGAMMGPDAQTLSRAFNARRTEVVSCFRSHPTHAPEDGLVQVVFTLAPNGNVQSASVVPNSVGATPLGACVTRIAQTTRFPAQGEVVRFRIPVRVTAQ